MANVKKGHLTRPGLWAKHFRKFKRWFWKGERQAGKTLAKRESKESKQA